MYRLFKFVFFIAFFASTIVSCDTESTQNGGGDVSTNLIQNPVSASGTQSQDQLPKIAFDKTEHDFGTIIEGEIVEYTFKFTNNGVSDLVLTKVSASCGCTIPTYNTKPIAPGEEGTIVVSFNSENRKGNQNKTIKVLANTQPSLTELKISANIVY